jgi:hypothetical protein
MTSFTTKQYYYISLGLSFLLGLQYMFIIKTENMLITQKILLIIFMITTGYTLIKATKLIFRSGKW